MPASYLYHLHCSGSAQRNGLWYAVRHPAARHGILGLLRFHLEQRSDANRCSAVLPVPWLGCRHRLCCQGSQEKFFFPSRADVPRYDSLDCSDFPRCNSRQLGSECTGNHFDLTIRENTAKAAFSGGFWCLLCVWLFVVRSPEQIINRSLIILCQLY